MSPVIIWSLDNGSGYNKTTNRQSRDQKMLNGYEYLLGKHADLSLEPSTYMKEIKRGERGRERDREGGGREGRKQGRKEERERKKIIFFQVNMKCMKLCSFLFINNS